MVDLGHNHLGDPIAAPHSEDMHFSGSRNNLEPIGVVLETYGGASKVVLDRIRLQECSIDPDPTISQTGQVGTSVRVRVNGYWILASLRDLQQDNANPDAIHATIDFLGQGDENLHTGVVKNFRRGVENYPLPGAYVYPVTQSDLYQIYGSMQGHSIEIGTIFPTRAVPAELNVDALLSKHFALIGVTGTGKSTGLALILQRICALAPEGHVVLIDPHGEYAVAFPEHGVVINATNLQIPYWMMNFEEHCEVLLTSTGADRGEDASILARCILQARMKNRMSEALGKVTVDSPIPYLISDFLNILQNEMGRLDKASSSAPYMRIKMKLDELRADLRYQFMFSGMLSGDTMAYVLSHIFRMPSMGRPISIVDVSGLPSEVTATVVALLSRLVFDFAVWAREENARPILFVCEEAHRYVPNERNVDGSAVGRIISRIAKEGRKYGVSLGLVTQRPSDLAEGVLSQCGTILAMRLNNERDQAFVRAAMPEGARGFLETLPALSNRECIACGEGVPIPLRLKFKEVEEQYRPASADPSFSLVWSVVDEDLQNEESGFVARTVQRWRAHGR